MLRDHNLTVHTYDEALAEAIAGRIVDDCVAALGDLTARLAEAGRDGPGLR